MSCLSHKLLHFNFLIFIQVLYLGYCFSSFVQSVDVNWWCYAMGRRILCISCVLGQQIVFDTWCTTVVTQLTSKVNTKNFGLVKRFICVPFELCAVKYDIICCALLKKSNLVWATQPAGIVISCSARSISLLLLFSFWIYLWENNNRQLNKQIIIIATI